MYHKSRRAECLQLLTGIDTELTTDRRNRVLPEIECTQDIFLWISGSLSRRSSLFVSARCECSRCECSKSYFVNADDVVRLVFVLCCVVYGTLISISRPTSSIQTKVFLESYLSIVEYQSMFAR